MQIIDRLALVIASIREVQQELVKEGADEAATEVETELLQPLQDQAMELDSAGLGQLEEVQASARMPKKWKKSSGKVKWICCREPAKGRTRKGKAVWKAWCQWKKGSKTGGMVRAVGGAGKAKPKNPMGISKRC